MADATTNEDAPGDDEDRSLKVLASHAVQLMEHFDSVQIIATKYHSDSGLTAKAYKGMGNWYANFGAVREWLEEKTEELKRKIGQDE